MIKQVLRSPLIGASIFVLIIVFLLFSLMNTQVILAKLCFGILVTVTFYGSFSQEFITERILMIRSGYLALYHLNFVK